MPLYKLTKLNVYINEWIYFEKSEKLLQDSFSQLPGCQTPGLCQKILMMADLGQNLIPSISQLLKTQDEVLTPWEEDCEYLLPKREKEW